ncbi:hypothetical protein DFQ26_000325 [Actinomortierella ambigua]|nr:hypothetical protein DFQ26_000325 [Actinomortierella ambigua]
MTFFIQDIRDAHLKDLINARPAHSGAPVSQSSMMMRVPFCSTIGDDDKKKLGPAIPSFQGDFHVDIKRITEKFFAPGSDVAMVLDALVDHRKRYHADYVCDALEDVKGHLVGHGCQPKIKDDPGLIIHDEAQFLGDQFNGSKSESASVISSQPLISATLR